MTIFFTASTKDLLSHKDCYLEIRNTIKSLGHSLSRDWIDDSIDKAQKGVEDIPHVSLYQDVMSAILIADLIVVDVTERSMSIGHQVTFALDKKKPVLLLLNSKENSAVNDLFISGTQSPYLQIKCYSRKEDIKPIIQSFINKYESKSKSRFNLVINKALDTYIEWAAFHYKISKTEVIHNAIQEKASNDRNYTEEINIQ